jgi:hypothetical protein
MRWFTLSAEQGNIYARFFLDHPDVFSDPPLILAATRLLHHLSRIFRDEQKRLSNGPGMQTDSKLRRRIREKKIAQGHAPNSDKQPISKGGFSCKSLNQNICRKKNRSPENSIRRHIGHPLTDGWLFFVATENVSADKESILQHLSIILYKDIV